MPRKPRLKLPPLNLKESLGERIARLRKHAGLTQVELAKRIGILQTHISAYEHDRLRLTAEMAIRFAQALRVGVDEVLGHKPSKTNGGLSLKLVRRLKGIEELPPVKQKALLQTIDALIRDAKRG